MKVNLTHVGLSGCSQSYRKPNMAPLLGNWFMTEVCSDIDCRDGVTEGVIQGVRGVFVERNRELAGEKGSERGRAFQVEG